MCIAQQNGKGENSADKPHEEFKEEVFNNIMTRNRNWTFTLNNYTEAEYDKVFSIDTKYAVAGKEIGANGTAHIQGYICFTNAKSLGGVRKIFTRAHWEIARGTPQQNFTYCTKEGNWRQEGEMPKSPEESKVDWDSIWNSAKTGQIEEIDAVYRIRYYSSLKAIAKDYGEKPRSLDRVCGYWIFGPSGVGKTHTVHTRFPDMFIKDASKWWDGYKGEATVLLDDLDPDCKLWIPRFLKVWADKFPFVAQNKGGSGFIRPERFIVTSNYSIDEFGFREQDLLAIKRRFIVIEKNNKEQNILL